MGDPTEFPTVEPTVSPTPNPTGMPTMEPTASPTEQSNDGLVIGLSVGGGGIILIATLVFVFCFLKRRSVERGDASDCAVDDNDVVSKDYTEIPDEDEDENENDTISEVVMA